MSPTQAIARAPTPFQAFGVLAMGVLAVSVGSIFIRLAQAQDIPSLLIAAARLTIASLALTPFVLRRYRAQIAQVNRNGLLLAGVSGVFLAMHFATWVSSLEYTSVLVSVVLADTSPLWAGIMEVVVLKSRLHRSIKIGLAAAFVGGILIAVGGSQQLTPDSDLPLGATLALLGALAFSIYVIIGRKLRAGLEVVPYIWLVYTSGAVVLLLAVIVSGIPLGGYSGEGYFWMAATALIPQLIGHSSLNYALGFLSATLVTLAIQLEPVISAIIAFFRFSERPADLQIAGSLAILLGIMLASVGHTRSQ